MKKTYTLLAIMAAALFVASCNKNASAPVPEIASKHESNEIIFSSDYNLQYNIETKATAVTSLSSFNVSAVTGSAGSETAVWTNVSFTDAGESRYAGDKYWPLTNDNPYRFYASNATLSYAATGATVTVDSGTDVVCAYLGSPTYKEVNALTFEHIFARIGDVTVSAAAGYTITGVSISITPKTSGTFNLLTGDGETNGTGWSATSNGSAYVLANATPGTKSNDLYLIPGAYTLTASWTAAKGDYSQTFSDKPYDVEIVGGKINSISTTLGGLAEEIKFTVSINPWGSNAIEAEFPLLSASDFEVGGDFTVNDSGGKVRFSNGNLQAVIGAGPTNEYNYTASEWKFAEHQWDYIGNAAGNTSFAVGTTVDLFGWVGESASYDSYGLCTNNTTDNAYYGINSNSDNLKTDWGSIPELVSVYGSVWRTLNMSEWIYVLSSRSSGSTVNGTPDARYTHATINTDNTPVNGLIIFPDDISVAAVEASSWGAINSSSEWGTQCTSAEWLALEAKGCVFLPTASRRDAQTVSLQSSGFYWSASRYTSRDAQYVWFYSNRLVLYNDNKTERYNGCSVRLVHDVL